MADAEMEKRPRALVVEDNRVNRLVARQMLKRAEIEADEAEGGARALDLLRERGYDVVLMDVQMPG
ncbi:MAG: response regulator, partial [Spirochaetota bacterium]